MVGDGCAAGGWGASADGGTKRFDDSGLGAALLCMDGALGNAPVGRSWQYLELLGDLMLLVGAGLSDGA